MTITPQRIKSERKRIGYTQQQIADLCEISRVQWGRYERGASVLGGRVLKVFVGLGANLHYLLTGENSQTELVGQIMSEVTLTDDELDIINLYRKLEQSKRTTLREFLLNFLK